MSLADTQYLGIIENILESTSFPVMIQPNAGLPLLEDGQTVYPMKVDEFIEAIVPLVKKESLSLVDVVEQPLNLFKN